MRVKLDTATANALRSIRSSKGRNIVEIAIEIGEDPATFFEGQDWSGLDLRSCNLSGVSFADATMDRVTLYEDQLEAVRRSGPASLLQPSVFQRVQSSVAEEEHLPLRRSRSAKVKRTQSKIISSLLREAIWEQHLKIMLKEDRHDFFFVDVGEDGPSWNARRLSDDFKTLFAKSHRPGYRTLLEISKNEPVSLPDILKLHVCLESYMTHGSARYRSELKEMGWDMGLPENSVVPCLYILDRKRSMSFAKEKNGVPELPKLVFDHIMRDVEIDELGKHLAESCGSLDGGLVAELMVAHSINGTKTKEVRVTSKIARGVVDFLNSKNESEKALELKHVFVWAPTRGEGRGRKTKAMSLANGNVLPTVKEAIDYPSF